MLSSDAASRDHMLKAIGAVLTFSETEIQRVRTYNASWWGSGSTRCLSCNTFYFSVADVHPWQDFLLLVRPSRQFSVWTNLTIV
jgi:hypothetical protein